MSTCITESSPHLCYGELSDSFCQLICTPMHKFLHGYFRSGKFPFRWYLLLPYDSWGDYTPDLEPFSRVRRSPSGKILSYLHFIYIWSFVAKTRKAIKHSLCWIHISILYSNIHFLGPEMYIVSNVHWQNLGYVGAKLPFCCSCHEITRYMSNESLVQSPMASLAKIR